MTERHDGQVVRVDREKLRRHCGALLAFVPRFYDVSIPMKALWLLMFGIAAWAQQPRRPSFDPRLPAQTILREDLFAGFMTNDQQRFLRGEDNLQMLLAARPAERPVLMAWKGAIAFKLALDAQQARRPADFEREYRKALDLYAAARKLAPADLGVIAVIAGTNATFADRLPERYRRQAWNASYQAYSALWRVQGPEIEYLPLHLKGELLGGMAQSAQRSNHTAEASQFLRKIVTMMPGTSYAALAKTCLESPLSAARINLTCHSCHEEGRLEARAAELAHLH